MSDDSWAKLYTDHRTWMREVGQRPRRIVTTLLVSLVALGFFLGLVFGLQS